MAWIESHTSLEKHSKVIRLRAAMRWSKNETIGFLHRFWWTVLETTPSGDVTALSSPEVMGETLDMTAETAGRAFAAMLEIGWLRKTGSRVLVHDWLDYASRYLNESKFKRDPKKMAEIKRIHDCPRTVQGQAEGSPRIVQGLSLIPDQPDQPDPPLPPKGDSWLDDESFKTAWDGWIAGRKKKPTPRALELSFRHLREYSAGDMPTAIQILERSTANGWTGIFPLVGKNGTPQPIGPKKRVLRELA